MAFLLKECRRYRAFRCVSLFVIFGVFFSLLGTTYCHGESTPIFYTVKISCVRDDIALHIREGDSVTDPVGKYNIGNVGHVEYHTAMRESYSSEKNEMTLCELSGYSDVYITVSAHAQTSGNVVAIGGYRLYVGRRMPLRLPDFYGEGVCVDIGGRHNVKK